MSPPMPALDHLIHLHPSVSSLESGIALYTSLGFLVTRGGNHADLLTTNALIVLPDGVYIELIAFLDYDAPGVDRGGETKEQWEVRREQHWWSAKKEGWIDWCLAGGAGDGQVEAINARAQRHAQPLVQVQSAKGDPDSLDVYKSPRAGGRTTLRGDHIKWSVTFPYDALAPLTLPFWCEDITPRSLRVPPLPPLSCPLPEEDAQRRSASPHRNGVRGVRSLLFLFDEARFDEAVQAWSLVLPRESGPGSGAGENDNTTFLLSTPSAPADEGGRAPIRVHARPAQSQEERDWLAEQRRGQAGALYEVELELALPGSSDLPAGAPPPPDGHGDGDGVERLLSERDLGRLRLRQVS